MPIDRKTIIDSFDPIVTAWDPASFLSVGNGDFAATVDCTGLQTIECGDEAATPLTTMASWGMHSYPGSLPQRYDLLRTRIYQSQRGEIGYMSDASGQEELYDQLRINPHRFNLARLSLYDLGEGQTAQRSSLSEIEQRLSLYGGTITSRYRHDGIPVTVETLAHPEQDQLSVRLTSESLEEGRLALALQFPYPSHHKSGSDYTKGNCHQSNLERHDKNRWAITRVVDDFLCVVYLTLSEGAAIEERADHLFIITTTADELEANLLFIPEGEVAAYADFSSTKAAALLHWSRFWQEGAFVDFTGSSDPRATELQRRILLSRYLLAIQSAGSLPPAETGLTCNSWYGKFHLEMHLLHAAHFPLWGQSELLEKSLWWYLKILERARQRAREQGYRGARWPKMSEPGGSDAPSPIGCLLCWQQPHPILFAALLSRFNPGSRVLAAWRPIIEETARFMVDYLDYDPAHDTYNLGPPVIPVQENHDPCDVLNPTFELSYWRWALKMAIELLGDEADPGWEEVRSKLAPLPTDGEVYLAHQHCLETYTTFGADHPSLLFALTLFDGGDTDTRIMANSLRRVIESWDLNELWGWDFPLMAMCAARLGEVDLAMDLLLMDSPKNTYTPNGHNAQLPKADLPLYLPGNGALLLAVALMFGLWDGAEGGSPLVPQEGWKAKAEGFGPLW